MEKLNALSTGEKLIAGGGIVMLIASFLPWYDFDFGLEFVGSITRNGWQSPNAIWSILATLIAVAMAAAVLAPKFGNVRLPDMGSVTLGQAFLGAGAVVAICVLLKLIGESSSMSFGFFLGILAAIACAAGGYLMYAEEKAGIVRR